MIGSFCQSRLLADLAHRGEAVHLRHHDVHQHEVDAAVRRGLRPLSAASASRPLRAISTLAPFGSSTLDSAKMLRDVVLDDQDAAAFEHGLAVARRLQHALPLGRQARLRPGAGTA